MKRMRFRFLTLMALCAVVTLTLGRSATAFSPIYTTGADPGEPDINNEARILSKYLDDLVAYQNECAVLSKRATLEHIHINPVQVKADDLKNRLPVVQNTIRDIIRRFKDTNGWDNLDKELQARLSNSLVHTGELTRKILLQDSFKKLLDDAAANLSSHKDEISIPVNNLRKRFATGALSPLGDNALAIVPVAYRAPAAIGDQGLACLIAKINIGLIVRLGGSPPKPTENKRDCACGYNGCTLPAI